ncbi:MAG: hypothetical protein NT030_02775 [Candidatus Saganbacteria bacterium]|nr:hypothetical protein [Candidatus Saganbacteria bacterium]
MAIRNRVTDRMKIDKNYFHIIHTNLRNKGTVKMIEECINIPIDIRRGLKRIISIKEFKQSIARKLIWAESGFEKYSFNDPSKISGINIIKINAVTEIKTSTYEVRPVIINISPFGRENVNSEQVIEAAQEVRPLIVNINPSRRKNVNYDEMIKAVQYEKHKYITKRLVSANIEIIGPSKKPIQLLIKY